MVTTSRNHDVSRVDTATRARVIELLADAYLMELETVMNYLAASTNLDGLHGRQVAELLSREVEDELGHARRIAERAAIAAYSELARIADGADYVTHDLAVEVLADEQGHQRLFEGLMRDLESRSA
jgi:bacterioferritin